jgi:hypothetical protein
MGPLRFFFEIILPDVLWVRGRVTLWQKWVPGTFPGEWRLPVRRANNLQVPIVWVSWEFQPRGKLGTYLGMYKHSSGIFHSTRRHIPENISIHSNRCKKFKCHYSFHYSVTDKKWPFKCVVKWSKSISGIESNGTACWIRTCDLSLRAIRNSIK